jgi:transposase
MYEEVKKIFAQIYNDNIEDGIENVAIMLQKLKIPKTTAYRWIKNWKQNENLERKKGSGRPVEFSTPSNILKIKAKFYNRHGRSLRKEARKLGCSYMTISRILKQHTEVRCYKKQKKPLMTEPQKRMAKPKCRWIYEKFHDFDFILDDESYFTLSNTRLSGNNFFYSSDKNNAPDDVRYKYAEKYEKKVLVWLAISPKGRTKALILKSKMAINKSVYLKKCIKARLMPFLNKKYKNHPKYVFWPDLASSHYASIVVNYLKELKVNFMPKKCNPANLPQVRPIEDYWAHLKRNVYAGGWRANNINQLVKRINVCLRKDDLKFVQKLALGVSRRLRNVIRHGI